MERPPVDFPTIRYVPYMSTTKFVHKATGTGKSLSKSSELEKQKHGANHVGDTTKTKKAKQTVCAKLLQ